MKSYRSKYQPDIFNVITYSIVMAIAFAWGAFIISLVGSIFH
jgi:hypothetical protein